MISDLFIKIAKRCATLPIVGAALVASSAFAQYNFNNTDIEVVHVRGNIYMLVGAGGNVAVQVGPSGALVVNSQYEPMADKIVETINAMGNYPIRFILNTSAHPDFVSGNGRLQVLGETITGGNVARFQEDAGEGAKIYAHEEIMNRMIADGYPVEAWPTDTYFVDRFYMHFNGDGIEMIQLPEATANGDSLVWFRNTDVVVTGPVYTTTQYPFIDEANGGTIDGVIDALITITDITIPERQQEGGTLVIPGYGRLSDEADVVEYRNMVITIRDRVRYMVGLEMTLAEILAERPSQDYDPRYGSDTGPWTTAMFIEAIYNGVRN